MGLSIFWIASPRPCPAASANVSPSAAPSCASRLFFLMDEPLLQSRRQVARHRARRNQQVASETGDDFHHVTHDQVEAMTMGDRIAVLADGILQQCDTPRNLYNEPLNVFVAGFIGSPAMNFFNGTLVNGRAVNSWIR